MKKVFVCILTSIAIYVLTVFVLGYYWPNNASLIIKLIYVLASSVTIPLLVTAVFRYVFGRTISLIVPMSFLVTIILIILSGFYVYYDSGLLTQTYAKSFLVTNGVISTMNFVFSLLLFLILRPKKSSKISESPLQV